MSELSISHIVLLYMYICDEQMYILYVYVILCVKKISLESAKLTCMFSDLHVHSHVNSTL